jgi:hypothetical protein
MCEFRDWNEGAIHGVVVCEEFIHDTIWIEDVSRTATVYGEVQLTHVC